jgi:hypothetical protein
VREWGYRRPSIDSFVPTHRAAEWRHLYATSVHPESVVLTVENTGEKLTPQLVSMLPEAERAVTARLITPPSPSRLRDRGTGR